MKTAKWKNSSLAAEPMSFEVVYKETEIPEERNHWGCVSFVVLVSLGAFPLSLKLGKLKLQIDNMPNGNVIFFFTFAWGGILFKKKHFFSHLQVTYWVNSVCLYSIASITRLHCLRLAIMTASVAVAIGNKSTKTSTMFLFCFCFFWRITSISGNAVILHLHWVDILEISFNFCTNL